MNETEANALMQQHGITPSQQVVYHYQGFKYSNLADAVSYAVLTGSRNTRLAAPNHEQTFQPR